MQDLKQSLRRDFKTRLAALQPDDARERTLRAVERLLARPEIVRAKRVFTCLSFGVEIDTWELVDSLLKADLEVFVPRAIPKSRRLAVHSYPCELRTLSFGLRQPVGSATVLENPEEIDAAIILGLAFDRDGYRLGYGGGYFDRFLSRYDFPAIGLAYDVQIADELPREAHDVPMRAVVTDLRTIP